MRYDKILGWEDRSFRRKLKVEAAKRNMSVIELTKKMAEEEEIWNIKPKRNRIKEVFGKI